MTTLQINPNETPEEPAEEPQEQAEQSQQAADPATEEKPNEAAEEKPEGQDEEAEGAEEEASEQQAVKIADRLSEAGLDIEDIQSRFDESGQLTDEDYDAIAKAMNVDREDIDTWVAGRLAQNQKVIDEATQLVNSVYETVGGKDAYDRMVAWAADNLSDEEKVDFNAAADSGNATAIKYAVKSLKASYEDANGAEPKLVRGDNKPEDDTFKTTAEITQAMRDPRYGKDKAYTNDVARRLAKSNVLNTGRR